MRSKRFEVLENRPVNQDGFVKEWPEVGLIAMEGPNDPTPSIKLENGLVVELDGKTRNPCRRFSARRYCRIGSRNLCTSKIS